MYSENSKGPRKDSWGTPHLAEAGDEEQIPVCEENQSKT